MSTSKVVSIVCPKTTCTSHIANKSNAMQTVMMPHVDQKPAVPGRFQKMHILLHKHNSVLASRCLGLQLDFQCLSRD
jgi:hypothetical protein